jgi:hypothetical protein
MTKRPEHLFVSSCDGGLYDTRRPDWSRHPPLRKHFEWHHPSIGKLADLKACLRAGDYAWPGGYPLYYLTHDCAPLCPDCVRENYREVVSDFLSGARTGWRIEACDMLEGDPDIENWPYCEHCSKRIGCDEEVDHA